MTDSKQFTMQEIDKALFIRNQGLFKAELRDMRDEDIKMRLATRRWMEMENRKELSWQEVLARTELERRQKRRPDLFQIISLESELWQVRAKLREARIMVHVVAALAVAALALPLYLWSGGSEPIVNWLTAAITQLSGQISGLAEIVDGWLVNLRF